MTDWQETGNPYSKDAVEAWKKFGWTVKDGPATFHSSESLQLLHPDAVLEGNLIIIPTIRRCYIKKGK